MKWPMVLMLSMMLGCSTCVAEETVWLACTPECGQVDGGLYLCWANDVQIPFTQRVGVSTWGPLEYVGPVRIEMQLLAQQAPWVTFPLEFDVLAGSECAAVGGSLIWSSLGTATCDQGWATSPLLDLGLTAGTSYYIRTRAVFDALDHSGSPAQGCLRVVAASTGTEWRPWGQVKRLYE